MSRIKYLDNEEKFEEYVKEGIVLVDFFTEWCGPCKMLGTVLENIDYMDILKVDADKFTNLATSFGIMSVPTLCFYKDGMQVLKEVGYHSEEELKEMYNKISGN